MVANRRTTSVANSSSKCSSTRAASSRRSLPTTRAIVWGCSSTRNRASSSGSTSSRTPGGSGANIISNCGSTTAARSGPSRSQSHRWAVLNPPWRTVPWTITSSANSETTFVTATLSSFGSLATSAMSRTTSSSASRSKTVWARSSPSWARTTAARCGSVSVGTPLIAVPPCRRSTEQRGRSPLPDWRLAPTVPGPGGADPRPRRRPPSRRHAPWRTASPRPKPAPQRR